MNEVRCYSMLVLCIVMYGLRGGWGGWRVHENVEGGRTERGIQTSRDWLRALLLVHGPGKDNIYIVNCDWIWKYSIFCRFHQNWDFDVFSIYNVRVTRVLSMSIYSSVWASTVVYRQWATALCNTAINIANMEGGKIAHVHIHNGKLFRFLQFQSQLCDYKLHNLMV